MLSACSIASPAVPSQIPRLRDFIAAYLPLKAVEWRSSHYRWVCYAVDRYLNPRLGALALDHITHQVALQFRAQLCVSLKPATVNKITSLLSTILAGAGRQYGVFNSAKGLRLKVRRTSILPFTLNEVGQLIRAVRPDYRNYLTVRCFTGMRSGEVHGLQWHNVDFDRRIIQVRATYGNGGWDAPKTDGSTRDIVMSRPVFDALKEQFKATGDGDLVFRSRSGTPVDNRNFDTRIWRPLLRQLRFPQRRPYEMRHTCATFWLASGESPEWVAAQLGHTTTTMLFRTYSRFVPNLTRQDGMAFESMLTKANPMAPAPVTTVFDPTLPPVRKPAYH